MKRRIIAGILFWAMIISLVPKVAFAEQAECNCGDTHAVECVNYEAPIEVMSVEEETPEAQNVGVAQVGETTYSTIEEAVKAAAGNEIVLLADYPEAVVEIGRTKGLCSFYAERGGMLVGLETK